MVRKRYAGRGAVHLLYDGPVNQLLVRLGTQAFGGIRRLLPGESAGRVNFGKMIEHMYRFHSATFLLGEHQEPENQERVAASYPASSGITPRPFVL